MYVCVDAIYTYMAGNNTYVDDTLNSQKNGASLQYSIAVAAYVVDVVGVRG